MDDLQAIINKNRQWAESIKARDASFFPRLCQGQTPAYLWIGCSDSRVPAGQITGAGPGELFDQDNIANLVVPTDLNCMSVLQYAVEHLKVSDIIVCGHYGCGGLQAALVGGTTGPIDEWLRPVREIIARHRSGLDGLTDETRWRKLCELNVIEQTMNVCHTSVVQQAWQAGQELAVHGLIYELADGLLKDMDLCVAGCREIEPMYERAIAVVWS